MARRTTPGRIRNAGLAALAACVLSLEARAQVEPETGLLGVPTARVAPGGTPSFLVGAVASRSSGTWRTQVPVALVLAVGSGLEIGVRLDDARPPAGRTETTSARLAAKWQLIASDRGWRVALAGLGARRIGGDSGRARYGAGVRATREGFRAAWSAFAESWSGGHVEAGAAVERQAGTSTTLGLEARAGDERRFTGVLSLRRVLLGGVNAWLGVGLERRDARTAPLLAVVLGVVPREASFVPRPRPPAAPPAAAPLEGPSELPDLGAALAREAETQARARARREFLGRQFVVPRPAPGVSLRAGRYDVAFSGSADSAGQVPSAETVILLVAVARQSPCGVTVHVGRLADAAGVRQQVAALRRALAILGVDPAQVIVREGGSSDAAVTVEVSPARDVTCERP